MVCLRKQARRCNFGSTLEENVQDQLIEKLPDVDFKKKLLDVNKITLEAAMDKVRKWEASGEQASQMVTLSKELGAGTNAVEDSTGRGNKGKSVCFNCGKEGHSAWRSPTLFRALPRVNYEDRRGAVFCLNYLAFCSLVFITYVL